MFSFSPWRAHLDLPVRTSASHLPTRAFAAHKIPMISYENECEARAARSWGQGNGDGARRGRPSPDASACRPPRNPPRARVRGAPRRPADLVRSSHS